MKVLITVVDVSGPTHVPNAKGGYNSLEVAYKQDGKISGKKLVDFNNPAIFAVASEMKAGKTYAVTTDKNAKGYWEWTSIEETNEVPVETPPSQPAPNKGGYQKKVRDNYETHEERALNRAAIIRQFSTGVAKDLCLGEGAFEIEEVLIRARRIEDFVYTDLDARAQSILTMAGENK